MQRFTTTIALFCYVLLAGSICFAQEGTPEGGAQPASPEMWDAYKKRWEGKWETTITTPDGVVVTATSTVEAILDGKALLGSETWSANGAALNLKRLCSWCPKRKSIVTHSVDSWGGHAAAVITLANGEERGLATLIDADGTEDSTKSVITVLDQDTIKVAFVEGRWAGSAFTWQRKKE